jgi:phage repressor protein C with HTH and peptisase S24 domain
MLQHSLEQVNVQLRKRKQRQLRLLLRAFLPTNKKHRVFQVDGESMLPIPDGAWIVCEYLEDWTRLKDGDRYVIVTEQDGVTFKIGYKRHPQEQKILLCSANPIYPPFEVDFEQVREVWKYRLCIS